MMRIARVCFTTLLALLMLVANGGASTAGKDKDNDPNGMTITELKIGNPDLFADSLINDAQESQDGADCPGATYHSVLTGPPSQPAQHSFQLVQALPYDVSGNPALDTPRSCQDGSKLLPAISWASRNLATFQSRRDANLNYRMISRTYNHLYSSGTFNTRAVRRYRSAMSLSWWNARTMDGSDPANRLEKLKTEMENVSPRWPMNGIGIKYTVILHSGAEPATGSCSPTTRMCSYIVGLAMYSGPLAIATRYYNNPYGKEWIIRYGCGEEGDTFFAHEATHQVGAVPGTTSHHASGTTDLMSGSQDYNLRDSRLTWDGPPGYESTVAGSSYVQQGALTGSTYQTCA